MIVWKGRQVMLGTEYRLLRVMVASVFLRDCNGGHGYQGRVGWAIKSLASSLLSSHRVCDHHSERLLKNHPPTRLSLAFPSRPLPLLTSVTPSIIKMHSSHILPLVAIPLATSAVIEPRQIEGRVYCSDEIGPNVDNCREAANLINKDSGSYGPIAEFWFGDCQINAVQGAGLTDYIGGQEYFDGVTGIIDACFGHTGSVQLSGLSVSLALIFLPY